MTFKAFSYPIMIIQLRKKDMGTQGKSSVRFIRPYTPFLYNEIGVYRGIMKLGFTGVYIIFLFLL